MNNLYFFTLSLIMCISCSDTDTEHIDDQHNALPSTASSNAIYEEETLVHDTIHEAYLIISGVNQKWPPLNDSRKEIEWTEDSSTKRYSRKYIQLDMLIEGRPVFADTRHEHFFFYFPYNECWMFHNEFPTVDVINQLENIAPLNFSEVIAKKQYNTYGFEYGPKDSWNIENLIFTKTPWNYSDNESLKSSYNNDQNYDKTSMYQIRWMGKDPMPALKERFTIQNKTKLYEEWVAAYNENLLETADTTSFIPKPIPIDYKIDESIYDISLRSYFIDQYKVQKTELITEPISLHKERGSYYYRTTEQGDTLLSLNYSYGQEIPIKTTQDSVFIPWIIGYQEIYQPGLFFYTNYQEFHLMMADKMFEVQERIVIPNANEKYLNTLIYFIYGDTYVQNTTREFGALCERIYTMPEDPKREIPLETGCWINISKKGISMECDPGGC